MSAETETPTQPPRPRGRPKTEDLAGLETRLLEVARELFFELGYGATSMNAVAAAARVSKTTLWSRFPSKADLFRAIVAEQTQRWGSGFGRPPTPRFDTLEESLFGYGEVILNAGFTREFAQLNRLIYAESERFPELGEAVAARFPHGAGTIIRHIERFAAEDGIPCRDPAAAAEYLLMTLVGWSYQQILTNRNVEREEMRAWLANTIRLFVAGRASW